MLKFKVEWVHRGRYTAILAVVFLSIGVNSEGKEFAPLGANYSFRN